MANYTATLVELLQEENPDLNVLNLEELRTASEALFFLPEGLNVLSQEHRAHFVTAFTTHYLYREIGYETLSQFKLDLAGRLFTNADYIRLIYDNLDKQVFSSYQVTKSTQEEVNSSETNGTENTTGETSNNSTVTETGDVIVKDTREGTSTSEDKQGKTTTTVEGTTNDTTTIDVETAENSTAETTNGGTETVVHTNDETTTTEGTNTQEGDNWDKFSDTPQNRLADIADGTYLTSARNNSTDMTNTTNETVKVDGDVKDTTTRDLTDNTTSNTSGTSNTTNTGESTENRSTVVEQETPNTATTTDSSSSTNTTTYDGRETATTDAGTSKSNTERHDSVNGTRNTDTEHETYSVTLEMLLRSESLISKLWDLFDDLFMLIYNTYY